jgi:hypothetical protein
VTVDICQWSRKSIDFWIDLLKTTPFHPGDEVVILSSGEEIPGRLATVLRNAGVAYRVLLRSEAEGLVMATGILSTPYTIALDSDNRMRLILRTVGGREADLVRTFFNR